MPYISTFVYCESIENENVSNDSKLHIVGPMHIITPLFVPSMFSFCVSFGILNLKLDKPHSLRFIFKGPDVEQENIIDTGDMDLPLQEVNDGLPDDMKGIMMNFDFRNIPFRSEGEYSSEIIIDGKEMGKFPIKVKEMNK